MMKIKIPMTWEGFRQYIIDEELVCSFWLDKFEAEEDPAAMWVEADGNNRAAIISRLSLKAQIALMRHYLESRGFGARFIDRFNEYVYELLTDADRPALLYCYSELLEVCDETDREIFVPNHAYNQFFDWSYLHSRGDGFLDDLPFEIWEFRS